jgi:hypothetical protein
MAPFTKGVKTQAQHAWILNRATLLGIATPMVLWGVTRPIFAAHRLRDLARAWDEHGFVTTVALGALATIAISNAALRDFMHYYVQVVPWAGLLLGLVIEAALGSRVGLGRVRACIVRLAIVVPAMLLVANGWAWRVREYNAKHKKWWPDRRDSAVCTYVRAHSERTDKLFVWGFMPELYAECERRPASRYVFTTFVAGLVPWFDKSVEEEDRLAVPGSRKQLLADLEATEPPVIVDAAKTMSNRPMKRYEVLAKYLDEHYCPVGPHGGHEVYLRKKSGRCPKD